MQTHHLVAERLRTLQLANNGLSDRSARALARCALPLRTLSLWGNRVTVSGARAVLASTSLSTLDSLDMRNNPIPGDAADALRGEGGRHVRVET